MSAPEPVGALPVEPPPPSGAVRLREASRFGLSPAKLRHTDYERVSHGLYAATSGQREVSELARMAAPLLPKNSGFGHLTSAELRKWWLPNQFPAQPGILFASTRSGVHRQRHGLYVRRSAYSDFEEVEGLPVLTAAETLLTLAVDLSLIDLVPMIDCALAQGVDAAEIEAAARPRSHGSTLLRRALLLTDKRSESWWESALRLMHVLTGLGPVDCQVDIRSDGLFVARTDLHLVGTTRYPECDGGEHRTRQRHERDLARDKAIHRLGLERFGYTPSEIASRPDMIIRDAEEARGLVHDSGRVRLWWTFAKGSSLTAYGRTRLLARLSRYRRAADRDATRTSAA